MQSHATYPAAAAVTNETIHAAAIATPALQEGTVVGIDNSPPLY